MVAAARCQPPAVVMWSGGRPLRADHLEVLIHPEVERLPSWLVWQQRPYPDANLMFLPGQQAALVDSGYVGHASETVEWVRAQTRRLDLVVNTHWHADHVGANGLLQAGGAGIAASAPDASAIARRDPGCCLMEYLDFPVAAYTVDEALVDGQVIRLGDADWQVVHTPGHTPGHLALWQPDERLVVVGDALSDFDVGWVNIALDGPQATSVALASLQRLMDLGPRLLLPSHGPIPADTGQAFGDALRRAQRLCDDPEGAVWYGARRNFAYTLMINDGLPIDTVESQLHTRVWLQDAARLLGRTREVFAAELVATMLRAGAIAQRDGRLHVATEHTHVSPESLRLPPPRLWPPAREQPRGATAPR
jgi:glyoxylase-like metal-dependent hydrolase (beta-lactamase superfamily II)